MYTSEANRFHLPKTGEMTFTVNHTQNTRLNQSEPHIHRDCEIYVNLSGDVSFEVEGRIYAISRGSVIITRPYEYHHCILHSHIPHEHFWITFSASQEDFLKRFFAREKGYDNLILLDEEELALFSATVRSLLEDSTPIAQRLGVLTLFHILEQGKSIHYTNQTEKLPADVVTALLYMDEHLTEDIDIKQLAALCGVSVNTLERHFKQALSTRPIETLRKKRLFAAMQHLRHGETVANAAAKSGFCDYSAFIQLFKKQFGMTPLKYKKQYEKR